MPSDDPRPPALDRSRPSPSPRTTNWSLDSVFVVAVTAGLLLARIFAIPVRFFDPDELEHSHAAWSVFKGLLPYRDFFEHHTPWYYYALAPFFRWFAVDQSFDSARHFLIFGRVLSLGLTTLSVVLVFLLGRRGGGRKVGLLSGLFLVAQPVLIDKTLEIRPDVLAFPFFLAGLWLLVRALGEPADARPSPRWAFASFLGGGLCFGAAIMCTQKMLFVLPGAFVGLGLWALAGGRHRFLVRSLAVMLVLAGTALPGALTWAGFALAGGGGQFLHNNFFLNARWSLRSSRNVLVILRTGFPVLLLALVGATVAVRRFWRTRPRAYGDIFLLCTLGGLLAGVAVVPSAYRQYYMMPLAIVCVFGARGLTFLVDRVREQRRPRLLAGAILLLLIAPVGDLAYSASDRDDAQLARLRYVFDHTAPTDPVLDGWLGSALFRPHPLYYFFMHAELLAMLTDEEKGAYVDALERGKPRPALITLDEDLKAIGPRFLQFVRAHYVSDDGLFYRRRAPVLLPAP